MERIPKLRIEMFGGFRCSIDGESPIEVPPGYITRLLTYLAVHPNQEIPKETLCDLFWEGVDPASARQSLRQALYELRHIIEKPPFVKESLLFSSRNTVRLNSEHLITDVQEFEVSLEQVGHTNSREEKANFYASALERYRGEFLPGFYEDEWIQTEQIRLNAAYSHASLQYLRLLEVMKRTEEAIALGQKILKGDPCQEEVHCALMRLYAAQGQTKMVQAQAEIMKQCLQDAKMGTPQIATDSFISELLRQARSVPAPKPNVHMETNAPVIAITSHAPPQVHPTPWLVVLAALILLAYWNSHNIPQSLNSTPPVKAETKPTQPAPHTTLNPITLEGTPAVEATITSGNDGYINALVPIKEGGLYVVGFDSNLERGHDCVTVKLDSDLQQMGDAAVWDHPKEHNDDRALNATLDREGNVILAAHSTILQTSDSILSFVKYDKNLKWIWDSYRDTASWGGMRGSAEFIDSDSKGNCWVGAGYHDDKKPNHILLLKLDPNRNFLTAPKVEPEALSSEVLEIHIDRADDTLYVAGTTSTENKEHPDLPHKAYWIRHFKEDGREINSDRIDKPTPDAAFLVQNGRVVYNAGNLRIRCYDVRQKKEVWSVTLLPNAGQTTPISQLIQDKQGNYYTLYDGAALQVTCITADGKLKRTGKATMEGRSFVSGNPLFLQVNHRGDVFVAGVSRSEEVNESKFTIVWLDASGNQRKAWVDRSMGRIGCKARSFCLERDLNPVLGGLTTEKTDFNTMALLMIKLYP